MQEARRLRLGMVNIDGEDLSFTPEAEDFEVAAGESVELLLLYDYRESSTLKEDVSLELAVELGGTPVGSESVVIEDRPFVVDDRRGFMAIPLKAPADGAQKGSFRITARYARSSWDGPESEEWLLERVGSFDLRVKRRVHSV